MAGRTRQGSKADPYSEGQGRPGRPDSTARTAPDTAAIHTARQPQLSQNRPLADTAVLELILTMNLALTAVRTGVPSSQVTVDRPSNVLVVPVILGRQTDCSPRSEHLRASNQRLTAMPTCVSAGRFRPSGVKLGGVRKGAGTDKWTAKLGVASHESAPGGSRRQLFPSLATAGRRPAGEVPRRWPR
jgi:hypothetical protein